MADTRRGEQSSIFDNMLAQTKKRFDALYRGGRLPARGPAAPANRTVAEVSGSAGTAAAASIPLHPQSAAVRRLNERFGPDWRYEIVERQRDGDEAIVLCRLIFGKEGAVRTQFGRATVARAPVAGTSEGLRFRLDISGAGEDERDAFRHATEAALMNCLDQSS
jgi:hypothetical protein